MINLKDMDQTQLLLKAMELTERVKELELERIAVMKSIKALVLYNQVEAM